MKEDLYILLLEKEAAGELTKSEQKDLDGWLAASAENRETAKIYRQILKGSEKYSKPVEVDLDKRFAEMESKMDSKKETVVREIKPQFNWWRVAATFALLIGTFFVWRNANQPPEIQWVTVDNTEISPKEIALTDNSKISLRGDSKLTHPLSFEGNERRVKLDGEAFFEIEKDLTKPFLVELESGVVRVLGTSFNISENENEVTVFVKTGVVQFSTKVNKVILKKEEMGVFNKKENTLKKEAIQNDNELSWLTQKFEFEKTPIKTVFKSLSEVYGKTISLENPLMGDCSLDISFEKESIESIVESIATVFGMEIQEINTTEILLKGGACN